MNAVFVVEVVRLILCPVGEIVRLIVCPSEVPLSASVTQSNPSLGAIQAMLHIDILFLIFNADEVCAVRLADFLCFGPVFARMTSCVAETAKV